MMNLSVRFSGLCSVNAAGTEGINAAYMGRVYAVYGDGRCR